jgi:hypothetical protein
VWTISSETRPKELPDYTETNLIFFSNIKTDEWRIAKSRDSSVGIATGYGLDARGSVSGNGKIFLYST